MTQPPQGPGHTHPSGQFPGVPGPPPGPAPGGSHPSGRFQALPPPPPGSGPFPVPPSAHFPAQAPPTGRHTPLPTPTPGSARFARKPTKIGPYEVTAELGQGGAGLVLRCRAPDGRDVAVKLLRQSSGEAVERFARERELQASLGLAEGFVPLLDHGEAPQGPYLVMPYVGGGTLRDKLRRGPLPVEEAAALATRLADALGKAHARGIVHRDLKPENILFTADGQPLVADLGLAKRKDAGTTGVSLSVSGEFRGTAGYMAPEQMKDAKAVGPPADVFAIGALLHECLAGEPAFAGDTVVAVVDQVAKGRVKPLARVRPEVPRWLAAIVSRCLLAAPERRFADGAELARALAAGPAGAATSGGGPPAALLVGSGVLLGLLAGVPLGVTWARRGAPPTAAAVTETRPATEAAPTPPPPVTEVDAPAPATERTPEPRTEPRATATTESAGTPSGPRPQGAWPHAGKATRGGPTLGSGSIDHDLKRLERFTLVTRWGSTRFRHTATVTQVVCAPDADMTITADDHGILRFWTPTGVSARVPFRTQTGAVKLLAASHDGRRLAWTGEEGGVLVRDLRSDRTQNLVLDDATPPTVQALAWSGDGRLLAIGSSDNKLRVWDFAARTIAYTVTHPTPVTAVVLTPDGALGVTATAGGSLHTFALKPGKVEMGQQLNGPGAPVDRVAITPDGRRVAALCHGKGLLLWDLERKDANLCGDLLVDAPRALDFSADGAKVAAVDASEVAAWDFDQRAIIKRSKIDQKVRAAAVKPGTTQVVVSLERTSAVGVVEAETGKVVNSGVGHTGPVVALAERGGRVWTGGLDGTLRRWEDPDQDVTLLDRPGWCTGVDLSPDGKLVASAWRGPGEHGVLCVSPAVEPGKHLFLVEGPAGAWSARFSADGATVLCASDGGEVERYAVGRAFQGQPFRAHQGAVLGLTLLPDGRLLTRGAERSAASLALWPAGALAAGGQVEPLARCPVPTGWGRAAALLPGHGVTALLGCDDGSLRWVDVEDQRELRVVQDAHDGPIMGLGVSPDGRLAVTGGMDRVLRVWDAVEGKVLEELALASSADILFTVVFARDGALLLGFGTGVVVRLEPKAP